MGQTTLAALYGEAMPGIIALLATQACFSKVPAEDWSFSGASIICQVAKIVLEEKFSTAAAGLLWSKKNSENSKSATLITACSSK